ncbi:MAG: leucyl aminopeptidase [Armatimonadota bacterium]
MMDIVVQQGDLTQIECDVLVVNLFQGVTAPGGATGAVDRALSGWISDLIAQDGFTGKANTVLEIPTFGKIPARRVVVVGLGEADKFGIEQVRQAAATSIKTAKRVKARTVATLLHGAGIAGLPAADCAQAVVEGAVLAGYEFDKYKTPPTDEPKIKLETLLIVEHSQDKMDAINTGVNAGRIIAEATSMVRDLCNEPPDLVTPIYLAHIAQQLAGEYGLQCEVWDEKRIAEERMNCLLMVSRGSAHPPRFIRLDYTPSGEPRRHVCVIGKGLCYDSGGLSLKPGDAMKHMKTDMSGAAAVLGIMRAIAQLNPQVAVTGLIPTCENMIDGLAYKVDDILRARNGKTIEIDNTDAEGRLVLADALSYAAEQDFDEMIDIATLTGGCIIALARVWTGVMGTDQGLIDRLIATGQQTGEKMWMLPFDPEVREMLDSDLADIRNSAGREGSAIQGGMFLKEFAGDTPWAHLDIAGTSYLDKPRTYELKGPTGVPTRTIVQYLRGIA